MHFLKNFGDVVDSVHFRHNSARKKTQKAVTASAMTAFNHNHHAAQTLCVNFFVVVDCMNNTLAGNFSALELLNKYGLLFKRFVLFKKVL